MSKELKNIASKMVENKAAEISSFINGIHKEIVEDIANVTIPYDIFGEYFLDFFKHGGFMDTEAPLTLKWLELAGGPYSEVDIVDSNNNIVITAPGIFCRPEIDLNVSNLNYNSLMDEYNLRSNRLHSDGINYANANLSGISKGIKTKHDEFNFRWEAVFKRYDVHKKVSKKHTKKEINNNNDIDFLDFD